MHQPMCLRPVVSALLVIFASGCQRNPAEPKPADSVASSLPAEARLSAQLHLPALAAGQKAPLVLLLHGLGSSGEDIAASAWPAFASAHGIAWAAPSGPLDAQGRRFWNAGTACCNFGQLPIDHVAALSDLIRRLTADSSIDPRRVFVVGHSNGGFMAHRLACERPELLRGLVAVAGTSAPERGACKAPRDLRVLQVHGDADRIVPQLGGHLFSDPRLPEHASARKTAADWAAALGCDPSPATTALVELETRIPGPETAVERYERCKTGAVESWTVKGGGHDVGFSEPAVAAVWSFLAR